MGTSQFIRVLTVVLDLRSSMSPSTVLQDRFLASQSQVIREYIAIYSASSEYIRLENAPVQIADASFVT